MYDPTRTTTLRRAFVRDLTKPFKILEKELIEILTEKEVDYYSDHEVQVNVVFSDKVRRVQSWLKKQLTQGKLDIPKSVEKAYLSGVSKAYDQTKRKGIKKQKDFVISKKEFIQSQFGNTDLNTLAILQEQVFSDLEGITKATETQILRVMTEGLIKGQSPNKIGKNISDRVKKIGITRAKTLARTSIITAHAEGALDAMENLGVEFIGVEVEWSTANDSHVCPLCKPLEGLVFPLQEARGKFPRHPNCRCSPIPAFTAVNRKKLKASIKRSISKSSKSDTWN